MKARFLHYILPTAIALATTGGAMAQTQTTRSSYFLEGSTYRHELNPAFMGERGYFSFPVLGNLGFGVQSTAGIGNFLYKLPNGNLTTFMHESVSGQDFADGKRDAGLVSIARSGCISALVGISFFFSREKTR